MPYENYRFISWSEKTPLTSERLAQMSTNIEQVKDATDDKPQGLIKIKQTSTDFPNTTGYSDFVEYDMIQLKNETPGGNDNRITLGANRYYRLTLQFPGFVIKAKGAEDSTFNIKMYQGISNASPTLITTWKMTPTTFDFYDVSQNTNATSTTVKQVGYPTRFGAGTYSIVLDSSTGITNESFYVSIKRDQGASSNNAPAYYVGAGGSSMQFYVEDIGGA